MKSSSENWSQKAEKTEKEISDLKASVSKTSKDLSSLKSSTEAREQKNEKDLESFKQ